MTRLILKMGDIFSVIIDNSTKKYFQYVANDLTQLNSNVIRAFKMTCRISENPELSEIIENEIDFYAHCFVRLGVKMDLWQKVGNIKDVGVVDVFFRGTNDYGHKLGEEPIKVSSNWYVWKINDEKFTAIGKLEGKFQKAEIGMVFSPASIVFRIKNGEYNLNFYPKF
jgi:hypothetical protein